MYARECLCASVRAKVWVFEVSWCVHGHVCMRCVRPSAFGAFVLMRVYAVCLYAYAQAHKCATGIWASAAFADSGFRIWGLGFWVLGSNASRV